MLALSKPESWISASLPDMFNLIKTIETSFSDKADYANKLASMGANNVAQKNPHFSC